MHTPAQSPALWDFSETQEEIKESRRLKRNEFTHTDFKHNELETIPHLSPVDGFMVLGSVHSWSYSGPKGVEFEKFGEGGL